MNHEKWSCVLDSIFTDHRDSLECLSEGACMCDQLGEMMLIDHRAYQGNML
jgi:hypothetical protein